MPKSIVVGSARSRPGSLQCGRWEAFRHPTGQAEFLPVVIAQGIEDGPCIWLTAGIHGPEHAGPLVLHRLLTEDLVKGLRGTIVAIPALNPVGLRTKTRKPPPDEKDPNRLWPDGKPEKPLGLDEDPPTPLEVTYKKLFARMLTSADYHIDYHNAWTGSLSFAFQDRMLYRQDADGKDKADAEALVARQVEMLRAYGHTVICEMPSATMIDEDLHRSTSGAMLYVGRKPSLTVELGTGDMPDLAIVRAAAAGTRNVLRWAGMLDSPVEPIDGIRVVAPGYPVRRCQTPRVKEAGVVHHLVEAGDTVQTGQPVAELRDIWGRPVGDGYVYAEMDGFVIGRSHGIFYYPGDAVLGMAVRNTEPILEPYPEGYFK